MPDFTFPREDISTRRYLSPQDFFPPPKFFRRLFPAMKISRTFLCNIYIYLSMMAIVGIFIICKDKKAVV